MKLITKAEWEEFSPFAKGYALYMQEAHPGSELKGLKNPYPAGSAEAKEFDRGEIQATLDVQDGEE